MPTPKMTVNIPPAFLKSMEAGRYIVEKSEQTLGELFALWKEIGEPESSQLAVVKELAEQVARLCDDSIDKVNKRRGIVLVLP